MVESAIVGYLERLEAAFPSVWTRVLAAAVVIAVVAGLRYAARRWWVSHDHERDHGRVLSRTIEKLAVSGFVAAITGLAVVVLIGVLGLTGELLAAVESLGITEAIPGLILSAVILAGAYTFTTFLGRVIQELTSSREAISEHQREVVYRLTQVTLYTLAGLLIVGLFTDNIGSLLVGAGFLGIVVGMAARRTLGAVLAGFVLMISRPFEIGDWVLIGDQEGVVTDLTVFNTRLQTFDGEHVVVPNDEVSGQAITNRTKKGRLRIEVEVGVDYDADPERAADVAHDAVCDLESVLSVPSPQVILKRFGDSAVVLGVRVWIDNPTARRMWRTRSAVVGAVKGALEAEGVKIPFPQRELMARGEAGGFRLAGEGTREGRPGAEAAAEDDD